MLTRRTLLSGIAGSCVTTVLPIREFIQHSAPDDFYAKGKTAGVTSTSLQATEAALWALDQGGNVADAYITAAITQTVVEPGLTSIGGLFAMQYFQSDNREISSVEGRLGPAAAEPYDFDRNSPVTQTGRAMPVPGFLAGVHEAHRRYGQLEWAELFRPAIRHATEGFHVSPQLISAANRNAMKDPDSKLLWTRDGRLIKADELFVQEQLGNLLTQVAKEGPEAFYTGSFARDYVKRAGLDGGKITLDDMKKWKERSKVSELEAHGNYRGFQVVSEPLMVYAMHLNEALDLRSSGTASSSPNSLYKQLRIMEEVFLSAKSLTDDNEKKFLDPDFAKQRKDFVLNSPRRKFTLDAIFNTCYLVIQDRQGNCAWGTHSINTPKAFGAGILVDGVYASYAINRMHVHEDRAIAPGIATSYALFKDGVPRLAVGSPGFGFVHGPYQYGTGVIEWNLGPDEAMKQPRFSLPDADGKITVEEQYDAKVLDMLKTKNVAHQLVGPSTSTGIVGALLVDDDRNLHFVQDGRRSGFARAR